MTETARATVANETETTTVSVDQDWTFDESHWPVLLVQAPPVVTARNWRKVFIDLEGYLLRPWPERKTFITLEGGAPSVNQAYSAAPFFIRNAGLMRSALHGWGLVLPSTRVQLPVKFMLWLTPLPVPTPIFDTTSEALKWAKLFYG